MIRPKQGIQFFGPEPTNDWNFYWYLDDELVTHNTYDLAIYREADTTVSVSGAVVTISFPDYDDDIAPDCSYSYNVQIDAATAEWQLIDNAYSVVVYATSKQTATTPSIIVNGTTVKSVVVNGTEVNTVKVNDTVVFAKEQESAVGTWYFNESVSLSDVMALVPIASDIVFNYSVEFTSNAKTYTNMQGWAYGGVNLPNNTYELQYYGTGVYGSVVADCDVYSYSKAGWQDEAYRTITITGGDDATNPEFVAWLKANATKLDGGGNSD